MAESNNTKDIHVELDVGNLCILSITQLKSSIGKELKEETLKEIASQGTRHLLNEIFKLPSEYHEHIPVAKLPEPTFIVPREKPVPKAKPMTKWEKFSKAKGITKRKRENLVWDETSKDWKPRYGYRGVANKEDWLVEVPGNADPTVDYFHKTKKEKNERVAKNEYQRLRNIAVSKKMKVTNLESVDKANKEQLSRSISAAKTSTASVGRFMDRLPREKAPKNSMKKRKFQENVPANMKGEKDNNLKILQELERKKPKLDIQEAVQHYTTKPLKDNSRDKSKTEKKRKFKKNKFVKNLFRSGKKGNAFKRPAKAK